ncbi:MAG: nucleotidyltransferase family protein [Pseudomonadota bacterium]
MISVLILAAGQSRRMRGLDKLMEPVDGQALLRRQAERAIATQCSVFIAVPALNHPRVGCLRGLDVTLIPVPDAAEGMGASLRTAMDELPASDAIMVTLADLAALETTDFERVIAARDAAPDAVVWRGATASGTPGHPILFDGSLRPAFSHLTGDTGGAEIVKAHADQVHLVPLPGDRALLDLDTPEDWAAWRARRTPQ